MDTHELYWAAGFFDGEGSASFYRTKRGHLNVQIQASQVHREPLERFQKALGGTIYGPMPDRKRPQNNPFFSWGVASRAEVKRVAGLLSPIVCSVKRDKIERLLDAIDNDPTARAKRNA